MERQGHWTLENTASADSVLQHVADRRTDTAVPCHVGTDPIDSHSQLVGDSRLRHLQPMKVTQKRRDVIETPTTGNHNRLRVRVDPSTSAIRRIRRRFFDRGKNCSAPNSR